MSRVQYALIVAADWIDDRVIGHRFYSLCQLIGLSSWWDKRELNDA